MVKYKAVDSIHYDLVLGKTYLVNRASIAYKDMKLKAGHIIIDWKRNTVYAYGMTDSTGASVQKPVMTQDGKTIEVDTITYNIKTKRAVIENIRTEEQQGILYGKRVKRLSDSLYYIKSGQYTTDKDPKPDYYIKAGKIKYLSGDKLITGPAQMYIHDVPTPLVLPFGYFPVSKSKRSGILFPRYGEENSVFSLNDLGYYFALSDYADLSLLFDIYSNGTYRIKANSHYALRYRFNGKFSFQYQNQIQGTRGLSDYSKNKLYEFTWSHSQDEKANPNLRLSADVHISNSKFFKDPYTLNDNSFQNRLVNNTSSSINLIKSFDQIPIRITLNATHSLNTNTKIVQMEFPRLAVDLKRDLHPFAPKVGSKKGLLENLRLHYDFRANNRIITKDSLFLHKEMFDSTQTGAQHELTLKTNATLLQHLIWNIDGNYRENWGTETLNRFYNPEKKQLETQRKRGFAAFRTFGFSTGLSTRLYGTKQFRDGRFIKAIRHTITPSIGFSFTPDFWSDFWGYTRPYRDEKGRRQFYTPFEPFIYGRPSKGMQGNLNFSLSNNLEAKIRSKTDSGEYEKIKILENLDFSTHYNMAKDSFRLSPIAVSGNTALFHDKLSLNFGATFSPYRVEKRRKVDRFTTPWMEDFNLRASYTLDNNTFSKKNREATEKAKEAAEDKSAAGDTGDKKTEETARKLVKKGTFSYDEEGYAHYAIPWSLSLSYNFGYKSNRATEWDTKNSNTLNLRGNIEFTPYWKVSFSSGYDFTATKVTATDFNFTRELRSFVITFHWIPFGPSKRYAFHIGIKSDMLKDLKYDRNNFPERDNPPF